MFRVIDTFIDVVDKITISRGASESLTMDEVGLVGVSVALVHREGTCRR